MKILLLIDGLGSGGAQRQIVTLAILLKKRGYNLSLLVYTLEDFFLKEIQENNIEVNYCITKNYLCRIIKIRHFIRRGHYNTVISFMDVPNFLNNFAAIGRKQWKIITSERSSKETIFENYKEKILNWFQRYSDYIVCNSYNGRQMWLKYKPQYANKLNVIYNPVILPLITSEYVPKKNAKLNIVIVASYQYLKNPIGLIHAVSMMKDFEKSKIEINWYGRVEVAKGNTKAYDESQILISENNLENIIHFNETNKDIANIMNTADFVALFSELEGLPNAICEGMMIGKPIIMTKISDFNNLVDESNGLLCDWDNPESIKNTIVRASNLSLEELKEMGLKSKEKALKLFSEETIINQWLNLILMNS